MFMYSVNSVMLRVIFVVLLMMSTFLVPWWWVVMVGILGIIAFPWFFEAVAIGLYMEVVFGLSWIPWIAIALLIILLVVESITYYISY